MSKKVQAPPKVKAPPPIPATTFYVDQKEEQITNFVKEYAVDKTSFGNFVNEVPLKFQQIGNYALRDDLNKYQPAGNYAMQDDLSKYQPAGSYASRDDLSKYQPAGNYALRDDLTRYQPAGNYQPVGNYALRDDLTKYQPAGNYALQDDLTRYQPAGNYALRTEIPVVPANLATKGDLVGYALKTELESLSKISGSAGPMGPMGPMGPLGPMGPMGPMGPLGPMGEQGLIGPMGPKGDQGLMGLMGPKGDQGLMGPLGPMGPPGPAGSGGADMDKKNTIWCADGAYCEVPQNGIALSNKALLIRDGGDTNHYLQFDGGIDGPKLNGYGGGLLSTKGNPQLMWNDGGVNVNKLFVGDSLVVGGIPFDPRKIEELERRLNALTANAPQVAQAAQPPQAEQKWRVYTDGNGSFIAARPYGNIFECLSADGANCGWRGSVEAALQDIANPPAVINPVRSGWALKEVV
jgi:hypothetical protein